MALLKSSLFTNLGVNMFAIKNNRISILINFLLIFIISQISFAQFSSDVDGNLNVSPINGNMSYSYPISNNSIDGYPISVNRII